MSVKSVKHINKLIYQYIIHFNIQKYLKNKIHMKKMDSRGIKDFYWLVEQSM